MADLLSLDDLPAEFNYPAAFIRAVELNLTQLEPWWIVEGELLRERSIGLQRRYPGRSLIPFAVRQDRDDVACFEVKTNRVVVVHDYAEPGWEDRSTYDGFNEWLRQAIEDFIEFGCG